MKSKQLQSPTKNSVEASSALTSSALSSVSLQSRGHRGEMPQFPQAQEDLLGADSQDDVTQKSLGNDLADIFLSGDFNNLTPCVYVEASHLLEAPANSPQAQSNEAEFSRLNSYQVLKEIVPGDIDINDVDLSRMSWFGTNPMGEYLLESLGKRRHTTESHVRKRIREDEVTLPKRANSWL